MNPVTYTMLDLKGLDLATVKGQSYPGLYNSIYTAMNRCQEIILCNWFVADILIPPTYCLLDINEYNVISINNKVFIYSDDTIEIPDMGTTPKILELSITNNGEYVVPVDYDGFNPVNVDVQPPLEEVTITENGEYLPSEGYYGIGKAIVSTPTGVPLLTRAEWDALTTAQKQSYGLVAIQDAITGFLRGELVNGADYVTLLPNSVSANVLAEALCEAYSPDRRDLGGITLIGNPVVQSDGSLSMLGSAVYAACPNVEDVSMTVYGALKASSGSFAGRLLSICKSASTSREQLICLNGNSTASVIWSSYGSDSTVTCDVTQKHVYAISANVVTGKSRFYLDGAYLGEKSFVALGYPYWSSNAANQYTNADFYYGAVVSGMEADATIIANMQNIMTHYGIT